MTMTNRKTNGTYTTRTIAKTESRHTKAIARQIAQKDYITPNGEFCLGEWCADQRTLYHLGLLEDWKIVKLESVPGWTWDQAEVERRFAPLLKSGSN